MPYTWLYAASYFEKEYGTKIHEDNTFECPHCGYVVYEENYPSETLCPHCKADN